MELPKKRKISSIFFGVIIGLFAISMGYFLPESPIEPMKAIITADAALIGFTGIIAVFFFTSLQNEQRRIDDIELREIEKIRVRGYSNVTVPFKENNDEQILAKFEIKKEYLSDITNTILKMVILIVVFLSISMFSALFGMSFNGFISYAGTTISLCFIGIALYTLIITFIFYNDTYGFLRKVK